MKNFIIFVTLIFVGVFLSLVIRQKQDPTYDNRTTLRVYTPSSFIKQWGPGPWLKEKFEASCDCKVEYHDGVDTISLIQKVKSEPKSRAADLVLGFDQYALEMAQKGLDWRPIKIDLETIEDSIKSLLTRTSFVPYDWGTLAFLVHKNEVEKLPNNLDDLLSPEYQDSISLQDPRTSTPGLQFLLWTIQVKGEEKAFEFLKKFSPQVKTWSASWSLSYGIFQKEQVKMTFSYVTSPIASLKEDPQSDVIALPFSEGHPVQYEFLGIPSSCQNCELAEKFVGLMLSHEGQQTIMEKNYMLPVVKNALKGTQFESLPEFKTVDMTVIPNLSERERILKKWSQMRRSEN